MLFSSLPIDTVHHILNYNGTLKLRNGKYMGQIPLTDERYNLLRNIPKMTFEEIVAPFSSPNDPYSSPNDMIYIITVSFTNKDHFLDLIVYEYNSRRSQVTVEYRNDRQGITLRYLRE